MMDTGQSEESEQTKETVSWISRVTEAMERNQEELLELVSSLIRFPSENPPGDSLPISQYIADYLQQHGIETQWHEAAPNMWNLVAKIGPIIQAPEGRTGGTIDKRLIFCGHTDVVPAGNRSSWSFDPYAGTRDEHWIYGRGATDMKAGLAGLLFAAVSLKREGVPLDGELILAVVPDEETGGQWGIPWLLERGLITGDGCIIAEPAFPHHPTIGQKGCVRLRLKFRGQPAHAALAPLLGRNAIGIATQAINTLAEIAELQVNAPDWLEPLMQRSKAFLFEYGFTVESEILDRIAFNVGTIRGGTSVNVVADHCELEADLRIPIGLSRMELLAMIVEKLKSFEADYELEQFGIRSDPNWTDPEEAVCQVLTRNIEKLTGHGSFGVLQWAASDARYFREYGIPVLQYGPADLSTIHQYEEKVPIEDTVRCAKVYAATAIDFLREGTV